jgi:hypothetical protein
VLRSRKARLLVVLTSALTVLGLIGLLGPSAGAATKYQLVFVSGHQPRDTEKNTTIRAADLNQQASFVQIQLVDGNGNAVTGKEVTVGFKLDTGAGLASGILSVTPRTTLNGIAEFTSELSIATPNEPQFTDYKLVPVTTKGSLITGPSSVGFDIFEDGESCSDTCDATLRNGNESYVSLSPGTLGASQIETSDLAGFVAACEAFGQTEIFGNSVFVHETTDSATPSSPAPVFVTSHVTRADMKAAANNGQAHITWCTATETEGPWLANGGRHTATAVDTNGSAPGGLLFVGIAPACPQANPSAKAPCIVSQNGDGNGGGITTGYLLGGDPPRRT